MNEFLMLIQGQSRFMLQSFNEFDSFQSFNYRFAGDRAALLRTSGGQNAHRNADPRYAPQWIIVQLALHAFHVTTHPPPTTHHPPPS